jgi:hypothetical protein
MTVSKTLIKLIVVALCVTFQNFYLKSVVFHSVDKLEAIISLGTQLFFHVLNLA